ncbi:MAG: HIT domain-containing protein [Planctomycetes bacterium]|nr:HIT domain-containing protein [Planctomycetota bacterium]
MQLLWAPWRVIYIKKHSDKAPCFLCAFVRQPKKDKANLVVGRGRTCLVAMNRYPYAVGHLMVAPVAHKGTLKELSDEERTEMLALAARAQEALQRAFKPGGYNLGINLGRVAGAGLLGHVHLHLVPRWDGDHNFMAVTGDTKVMPMGLREAYGAIVRHY